MSRPLVAVLGTWILVAFSGCPGADSVAPTAPPVEDVEGWPPVKGQPYHDMLLRDLSGESVRLASLKGTPLLIQFVATKCPGNVAYTAGDRAPPFEGLAPSPGCAGIDEVLASSGMDLDAASLLRVHVLVFETSTPVSLEQAQAWDAHFGLSARPNTLVFVADPAYATPTTLAYVPGYHLVDGDFTLVSDGTPGHDPLFEHTLPQAYRLVTGEDPQPGLRGIEDYAVPEGPLGLYAAGLGLLTGGAFEALESRLEARVPARRLAGSYEDLLHEELLALGQPYNVEALEAWAAARPQSFFAWIALGHARREQAWDARGGGVASTVTEEGWKDFKRYDVLAREAFETALELRQDLPYAHAWLIALGIDQGHEESVVLRHFRAAEAIDPQFVLAYELVLGYLSPRWHGSHERVQAFVQQALEEHPREPALRFLEYRMLRDTVRDLIAAGAAEDTSGVLAKHPEANAHRSLKPQGCTL